MNTLLKTDVLRLLCPLNNECVRAKPLVYVW